MQLFHKMDYSRKGIVTLFCDFFIFCFVNIQHMKKGQSHFATTFFMKIVPSLAQ